MKSLATTRMRRQDLFPHVVGNGRFFAQSGRSGQLVGRYWFVDLHPVTKSSHKSIIHPLILCRFSLFKPFKSFPVHAFRFEVNPVGQFARIK
ncbi:MAG: hypothetical protein ACI845_002059 [Gammaproteobacteria bacterium]|jgi:hypothetical protein